MVLKQIHTLRNNLLWTGAASVDGEAVYGDCNLVGSLEKGVIGQGPVIDLRTAKGNGRKYPKCLNDGRLMGCCRGPALPGCSRIYRLHNALADTGGKVGANNGNGLALISPDTKQGYVFSSIYFN